MKMKILAALALLIVLVIAYALMPIKQVAFDAEVWKRSNHCKPIEEATKRFSMTSDLSTNQLPGKSKAEIELLLGPSLEENVLRDKKRDLLYCIGHGSKLAMTMNWLAIHLDEQGKFGRIEILTGD